MQNKVITPNPRRRGRSRYTTAEAMLLLDCENSHDFNEAVDKFGIRSSHPILQWFGWISWNADDVDLAASLLPY